MSTPAAEALRERIDAMWVRAYLKEIGPACPDCEEGPYECRCGDAAKETPS